MEKLEIIVIIKPRSRVGIMILRRPRVSARKPSRWELLIMPAKPIALSTPRSATVKCRSQCETGSTKPMLNVSSRTLDKMTPDKRIKR